MSFLTIMTIILEKIINSIIYREQALESTQRHLCGHSLSLIVKEINLSMVFIFSKNKVKIFNRYKGTADCTLTTTLPTLLNLYNYQEFITLLHSEKLEVTGDLRIIEIFLETLALDNIEFDLGEYLSPWTGDIIAESVSRLLCNHYTLMHYAIKRKQECLSQAIIEEWRLSPGSIEISWLITEIEEYRNTLDIFDNRIRLLEIS
ncbi:SCP2 domain-containing protein [Candidatus Erwinia haradaeae]|uniref:Ubiquinone biosynthesis protein UbiJ n=1 Tax=Candidatus Erwinia haradaeae TaxID=1922217 RepID=A0A451DII6_9GAMM|nr:SCP2 sterol-binding domain-containing protein [Candidatus Erwinia haradaeae]VFP86473.1 Ubiquinone biosynthesis protein UbiJ [Candidatus Erwinia haradaeae]